MSMLFVKREIGKIKLTTFIILSALLVSPTYANNSDNFYIFHGSANKQLGESIANHLQMPLGHANISRYNDGEIGIEIFENIRNKDIFIIQSTCPCKYSVNDNIMELYLMARALKRSSARHVIAVIPYFGYARQDRKTAQQVPISAADIAMLLETAGIDRVITVALHSESIQGFFQKIPIDNIYTSTIMVPYFANLHLHNPVIISSHTNGISRANRFRDQLSRRGVKASIAFTIKQRSKKNNIKSINLVGDVKNMDAIIIDEMCDTGETLAQTAALLKAHGARNVFAAITHPVLSGNALDKLAGFKEIVITDTIPLKGKLPKNIKQISIAPLLAEFIKRTYYGEHVPNSFFN